VKNSTAVEFSRLPCARRDENSAIAEISSLACKVVERGNDPPARIASRSD
jgi:hypothetical protein